MGFTDEHKSATAQNAARRNADYDAFVDKLDFSSGKYTTKIVPPGLRHTGDLWRVKLFSKDVIEKYGAGEHRVSILGPDDVVGHDVVLCTFIIAAETTEEKKAD